MKSQLTVLGIATAIALSGCGNDADNGITAKGMQSNMNHSEMDHVHAGEIPRGLKEAESPKFTLGSKAIMKAGHMKGMKGATATIVGAYDTTVYEVSYTPVTGGPIVSNHKWIIHQEIEGAGDKPFEKGAEVVLRADHMKGMNGATATIDAARRTTVYVVDFYPTDNDKKVANHRWVTEDELSAI